MKNSFKKWFMGHFYHGAMKAEYQKRGLSREEVNGIIQEHKKIAKRAKDMNDDKLLASYMMGIYFIAMNRRTGLSPEENYEALRDALSHSKFLKSHMGSAEEYLDEKKMPERLKWAEESKKRTGENNWVVDVLPGCEEYDLGYNYHECGICKICADEGCPELAKYLCKLDYVIADAMGAKLVRTKTLAEGGDYCDFRYSRG